GGGVIKARNTILIKYTSTFRSVNLGHQHRYYSLSPFRRYFYGCLENPVAIFRFLSQSTTGRAGSLRKPP
ncbi:MAG: hypothetical protein QF551_04870, partial [Candidatus Marinimicrobia bacterium]|nr:hypothetical protein [Candidatus Neomarinimicrobiota bacterium]